MRVVSEGEISASCCASTHLEVSERHDKAAEAPVNKTNEVTPVFDDCTAQELTTTWVPSTATAERSGPSRVDASELVEVRNDLAAAKRLASTLKGALGESRAEVQALREQVSMDKDAAEQQTRNMALLR